MEKGPLAQPILDYAGEDLSHWFDAKTGDVKTQIDRTTNLELPHLPYGRFIHVAPPEPVSDWATDFGTPWWRVSWACGADECGAKAARRGGGPCQGMRGPH